ncbi:hypothetical protein CTI12_AA084480 [Artemisia annua]|uniref:Uncharacterized protein n=1 Tax=Artemisia annua TaxID=35608 RepID=A0A2U1Q204_ARTAN|nr:hypothetical protein CTI12_AA084480 [Artemisia annua]
MWWNKFCVCLLNKQFLTNADAPGAPRQWWFGGGTDWTPAYIFDEDVKQFHTVNTRFCLCGCIAKSFSGVKQLSVCLNSKVCSSAWNLLGLLLLEWPWFCFLHYAESIFTNGGNKAVIIPHSMGVPYFLHFMKWVEAPAPMGGGGGPDWCAKHIKAVMNIGGPFFRCSKSCSWAFLC